MIGMQQLANVSLGNMQIVCGFTADSYTLCNRGHRVIRGVPWPEGRLIKGTNVKKLVAKGSCAKCHQI